jgi:plasmid stabilization system protein ParE
MKQLIRTQSYKDDLDAIESYIAQDNPKAGANMWLHIDDQVEKLGQPTFSRRIGRVPGTFELVAHSNYVVVLQESSTTVTVLNVLHSRKKYP